MFLIRFAVLAVFVIMLLPTGPDDKSGILGLNGDGSGFCMRYPKTCDASGELYGAFKQKLSYGVVQARQLINPQSGVASSEPYGSRFDEEAPPRFDNGGGALAQDERGTELRRY